MKNVAHPDYELRAGTLLHDPINKEFSKILTPRNITEDLCLYHIAFNKDALSYFTRVPEDLNDRLEKFMSRYGKEMPDKDVEIKKRQAQVLSKQIDSVKATGRAEGSAAEQARDRGVFGGDGGCVTFWKFGTCRCITAESKR